MQCAILQYGIIIIIIIINEIYQKNLYTYTLECPDIEYDQI